MTYYMIDSMELKEKGVTNEGLYKVFDCTSYEDVRAELESRGYKEEMLTDDFMNELRKDLWKTESPTRARDIVDILEVNNLIKNN
ncbi:MAG: hypothetical protein ACRC0Y_04810 [Fusobacteriaceae bacterium]